MFDSAILIDSINAGGNAEKAGGFKVGDTILSLSDSRDPMGTTKVLLMHIYVLIFCLHGTV